MTMDWTRCIVCQQQTAEVLRCPLKAAGAGDKSEAYASFLENVNEFRDLNQLLANREMDVYQLVQQEAKWHKSCHMKFSKSKLQQARKRESDEATGNSSKRRHVHRQTMDKSNYIFCDKDDGQLHEFRTFDADKNVRRMAADLQDTLLLARIEGGDLTALDAKYYLT